MQFTRKGACCFRHVMRANSTTNGEKSTALRTPKLKKVQITTQISSKDPNPSTLHSHQRSKHSSHDSTIKINGNVKDKTIFHPISIRSAIATCNKTSHLSNLSGLPLLLPSSLSPGAFCPFHQHQGRHVERAPSPSTSPPSSTAQPEKGKRRKKNKNGESLTDIRLESARCISRL